jgi:cyclic pyranopterin phosphate synthase
MSERETTFSHLREDGKPQMVDVSGKEASVRVARAQSVVRLPPAVHERLRDGDWQSPKGPVFQTAILAGVMAAKKTSELIPLCHPIALEDCDVDIILDAGSQAVVTCTCKTTHKTGVEMEALTGASVAALTIYDMCKGLSHEIEIVETCLLEKTGGKADYRRDPETPAGSS